MWVDLIQLQVLRRRRAPPKEEEILPEDGLQSPAATSALP